MAYVEHPDRPLRLGFNSYADDTPRLGSSDDHASAEPRLPYENISAETRFSYDAAAASDWEDEPLEAPSAKPRLALFLAAALAAAILAFIGTTLLRSMHHQGPAQSQAPGPTAVAPAQVRVAPAAKPGAAEAPANAPLPPVTSAVARPAVASPPRAAVPDAVATAKPHRTPQTPTVRRLLAPLDCARPASHGQSMVCASPMLLAHDRRMARAYAEARAAGAPSQMLRRDQARWLKAREAASWRSKYAVARLYRIRIDQLESRPYRTCTGVTGERDRAAADPSRRSGLVGAAQWLLSVPGRIVSKAEAADCG